MERQFYPGSVLERPAARRVPGGTFGRPVSGERFGGSEWKIKKERFGLEFCAVGWRHWLPLCC